MADEQSRRRFLKIATGAIGGAIGVVMAVPLLRYFLFPLGRRTVTSSAEPVDVGAAGAIVAGEAPVKVVITAKSVRDAWGTTRDVKLGAAWLVRSRDDGALRAFSTVCPHLGCAIGYDDAKKEFQCPCHTSAFGPDGVKRGGPSKRGMDPLPVEEKDGRVLVTYKKFRTDIAEREET